LSINGFNKLKNIINKIFTSESYNSIGMKCNVGVNMSSFVKKNI